MQRLIEQPTGESDVLDGGARLGRVHYHLDVYQHFSDVENEPVPLSFEVEGRLTPLDRLDLADLHRRGTELTLHLADGRVLNFSIADELGRIRSTGRSLHTQ